MAVNRFMGGYREVPSTRSYCRVGRQYQKEILIFWYLLAPSPPLVQNSLHFFQQRIISAFPRAWGAVGTMGSGACKGVCVAVQDASDEERGRLAT